MLQTMSRLITQRSAVLVLLAFVALVMTGATASAAGGPTGAIFTTTPDGSIVNENVRYGSKLEVYLDGGPGQNAPASAAGLDAGYYVFQITDPSGGALLSEDPTRCRVVPVSGDGIIVELIAPTAIPGHTATTDNWKDNGTSSACHTQDDPGARSQVSAMASSVPSLPTSAERLRSDTTIRRRAQECGFPPTALRGSRYLRPTPSNKLAWTLSQPTGIRSWRSEPISSMTTQSSGLLRTQ
jgi:hypothetical protein